MRRREFLALMGGAMAAVSRLSFAAEASGDVTIKRVTAFDLKTNRIKFVGKNSRLDDHGDSAHDRIVVLTASDAAQGFGVCRADEKALRSLIGKTPTALAESRVLGVHAMPLWDLLGKQQNKPVYQLLTPGQSVLAPPRIVPVYDGSIYFIDLLDRYNETWRDRFKEEIDNSLSRGHRALKVKIGRGAKWMPREEGDARDIEVLKLIRAHTGPGEKIAVDSNNGYGLERTCRLLDALPDYNFDFIEEMFPEEVEQCLELRKFIKERKLATLIADGETQSKVEPLVPFMNAGAIDLYQLDVNAVGIEGLLKEASLCRPTGGRIAPHTWGTLLGFYAQLHVACAIDNFYSGEQDPLSHPAIVTDAYVIKDGKVNVPDAPGFGLTLDASKLPRPALDLTS